MSQNLLEKISIALNNSGIDYMIIGGQAVLIYGFARFTSDIDIILDADVSILNDIDTLCKENDFVRLKDDEFSKKTNVAPIYDPVSNFRIDLIFSFSEFEKNSIIRAKEIIINNTPVKYASLEDLIIMKLYASRVTDINDIEKLILLNSKIDLVYIRNWLKKFDQEPGLNLLEKFNLITQDK